MKIQAELAINQPDNPSEITINDRSQSQIR